MKEKLKKYIELAKQKEKIINESFTGRYERSEIIKKKESEKTKFNLLLKTNGALVLFGLYYSSGVHTYITGDPINYLFFISILCPLLLTLFGEAIIRKKTNVSKESYGSLLAYSFFLHMLIPVCSFGFTLFFISELQDMIVKSIMLTIFGLTIGTIMSYFDFVTIDLKYKKHLKKYNELSGDKIETEMTVLSKELMKDDISTRKVIELSKDLSHEDHFHFSPIMNDIKLKYGNMSKFDIARKVIEKRSEKTNVLVNE
tara:strand:- start:21568 stop:22338 length:771 start_codon:yes stop_codon:yes gene_type:complete